MTIYFFYGTIALLVFTVIFYVVAFSLIYYWHEKKTTVVIVPLLLTFEFFTVAFLVMSLFAILAQYLPDIVTLILTR